jgi:hypothetical protein
MEGAAALGRHGDAAALAAGVLGDPAAAATHYCRAGEWREVGWIVLLKRRGGDNGEGV